MQVCNYHSCILVKRTVFFLIFGEIGTLDIRERREKEIIKKCIRSEIIDKKKKNIESVEIFIFFRC